MKKILITIFVLTVANGLCFAADMGTAAPKPPAMNAMNEIKSAAMESLKMAQGKVESVSMADATKGTKSEVILVDDMGKKWTFGVQSTTTIWDADVQPITLDKIKADDKVMVKYSVNKEGMNEAQSISLMK